MKLYKEVLKKYRKLIVFYVLIGIFINFLNVYEVNLFQKIIDTGLDLKPIIFFGIIMIVNQVLGYIENYPEQQLDKGLPLSFKVQALKKMKTIDYLEYQKLGTGLITQRADEGSRDAASNLMNYHFKLIRYLIPKIGRAHV